MDLKYKILIGLSALTVAFATGRYSVRSPEVQTTIDDTRSSNSVADKDTHRKITSVTEKDPNGVTRTTTTTVEDITSKKEVLTEETAHIDQTVTPAKTGTLNLSGLVGMDFATYTPTYGVSISKELIGPITIGAFGLTNRTVGLSVGVNF